MSLTIVPHPATAMADHAEDSPSGPPATWRERLLRRWRERGGRSAIQRRLRAIEPRRDTEGTNDDAA